MALQGKPVTEILEADLRCLITDRVRESQRLEFKRQSYGRNDEQTREMLRDISAMANAFGGDLLIGVDEDSEGVARDLPGIENADGEALRVVSSCLSNIEERIPGLIAWPVLLSNGRQVIVIRIPRSPRAPHMVTFRGINQFWVRHDRQKSPMSVQEIRELCLKVEGLMQKLDEFLEKRKSAVRAKVGTSPYYLISLTPMFVGGEILDIQDVQLRNILQNPPDQRPTGWNLIFPDKPRPTLRGLAVEVSNSKTLELFRNGHLELRVKIQDRFLDDPAEIEGKQYPMLRAYPLVEYPVSLLRLAKAIYSHLGLTDPAVFSLAILSIKGFALARYPNMDKVANSYYGPRLWNVTDLEVDARQVMSLEEPDKVAREFVDRIWQAFGYEQAPLFDAESKFKP